MGQVLKRVLFGIGVIAGLILTPVLWTETKCYANVEADKAPFLSVLDASDRRPEVNTYLTYPEWSIVHAYEDFAGVVRQGSESDFGYLKSITSYWRSLCSITRLASSRGVVPGDTKTMLYVIGVSFAGEMAVKGAWEKTIGRVTAWIRGGERTPEDDFALAVADDYAAFLHQTPWYRYPFASKLKSFWAETPLLGGNVIRKVERRLALSLEYGFKAIYAQGIGFLAGLDPAPLSIRSVVTGIRADAPPASSGIKVIKSLSDTAAIIETPRYKAFTDIISGLGASGQSFAEIAGNDDILVTVIARNGADIGFPGTNQLFEVPLQARPGERRLGLDVKVPMLTDLIRKMNDKTSATGVKLEHVYDY